MEQHAQQNAPPPAPADRIANLPKISIVKKDLGEHSECAICQEEYADQEKGIQLPCHHIFHPTCIESWLKVNGILLLD